MRVLGDEERRSARFVCVLALVAPDGEVVATAEGACEGRITRSPRGAEGFGYDPVFEVAADTAGRTMAELTVTEKRAVSHRGRAFEGLRGALERLGGA